ncbi:hypothetical protein VMCG_00449 [Cytospora schulzeri]|uniref:Uncharacterized protein n=1 Tax=Cytospora schulzeri TaxID=448051 RepID=A0A423X8I7_9PEZI|nr:hypothetical protein VMCG_00449 [Valsa malicola]
MVGLTLWQCAVASTHVNRLVAFLTLTPVAPMQAPTSKFTAGKMQADIPKMNRSTGNLALLATEKSEKARMRMSFDAGAAAAEYDHLAR